MPDYQEIYQRQADRYDLLVSREDYQGNILGALQRIRPLERLDVVELGAGTGRLTCMLAPLVGGILALDASGAMLAVAIAKLRQNGWNNWRVAVGDNRSLPVRDGAADMAIAGWSFGHATEWHDKAWRDQIGRAIGEMRRVLRPGGTAVILETLGTGRETPEPPTEALAAYYAMLEEEYRFTATWVRSDFRFDSQAEAAALTRFFFGSAMSGSVDPQGRVIIPECTGIWWLTT